MPKIANQFTGHLDEIASKENEFKWHKQLGKVFGFYYCDMPQLRVADLNLINEVFLNRKKLFDARTWREWRLTPVLSSILFNEGEEWKKIRRILQPAIAEYRIKKHDDINIHDIQCGIDKLIQHFKMLTKHPDQEQEEQKNNIEDETKYENMSKEHSNTREFKSDLKCEYSEKGFMAIEHNESPTGWALDINAHQVMQVVTLDVIFRLGFDKETVDVTKGASDPNLSIVKSLLLSVDNLVYKIAIAIPLARPFIELFVLFFDKNMRCYINFVRDLVDKKRCATIRNNLIKPHHSGPKRIYHVLLNEYLAGRLKWTRVLC